MLREVKKVEKKQTTLQEDYRIVDDENKDLAIRALHSQREREREREREKHLQEVWLHSFSCYPSSSYYDWGDCEGIERRPEVCYQRSWKWV